ncbi:MAG TPA: hypothetical protein VK961_10870 [Chthoniobacter sp.]|nr:hypothetical protein [Chthoniobacter sp.]
MNSSSLALAFSVLISAIAWSDDGERPEAERWKAIESQIFAPNTSEKYVGQEVICATGKTLSRRPLTVRLKNGTIISVSHLNSADRELLSEFRSAPFAKVHGWITAIDASTRTVTIKAFSVDFTNRAPHIVPCPACPSGYREL